MSQFLGQLPLVEVEENETGVTLTFLHEELGEIRQVKFNKKRYDSITKKWSDNAEQYERFEKNMRDLLGVSPDNIEEAVGNSFNVWETDSYCALWEIKDYLKFSADMAGQIIQAELVEINVYDSKTELVFDYNGDLIKSNINYGQYLASLKKSLPDPQKRAKQMKVFKEKYHVDFEDRDELIGKTFMIEIKANNMDSTGKNPTYLDVKALPKI